MKVILSKDSTSVRISPAVALHHPSYKRPAVHAANALHHLFEQYNLKMRRFRKKSGNA